MAAALGGGEPDSWCAFDIESLWSLTIGAVGGVKHRGEVGGGVRVDVQNPGHFTDLSRLVVIVNSFADLSVPQLAS